MSSPYQILANRPLDQWKVTELKEELKKRKLTSSGLKQDLVRRLDEAVRLERENAAKEARNGVDSGPSLAHGAKGATAEPIVDSDPSLAHGAKVATAEPIVDETAGSGSKQDLLKSFDQAVSTEGEKTSKAANEGDDDSAKTLVDRSGEGSEKVGDDKVQVDINESAPEVGEAQVQPAVETSVTVTESKQESQCLEAQSVNEMVKPPLDVDVHDSSAVKNQVSEVNPHLGLQVNSDSISTDSVSINEKNELKDNINADNVKLELDVVKAKMVEPSSSNIVRDGGVVSHPMDVEETHKNRLSVDEKDYNSASNADISKSIDAPDLGYSEKLNLDRSSGDDSMEEDVTDSKQIDSNYNSGTLGEKSEKGDPADEEESPVDIVGVGSVADKGVDEKNDVLPVVAEKRKLNDQEAAGGSAHPKRQRKWNTEKVKPSEPQDSNLASTTVLKEKFQSTAPTRNARSDTKSSEDSPKERVVPPSQNPSTNSLRIDNFVRPFTLKAVQELLRKTGTFTSFWMDQIKTHCYVTYSSVEEAIATRNALYNFQWPPYGGQFLAAEFVDPQEVKMRVETPSQAPAAPISAGTSVPQIPASQPQPSPRQRTLKEEQLPPAHALPPPPPLSSRPPAKDRITLPPPPPKPEKVEPPIVTLDDLFRKTRATPLIYYLPLSEEQVAAKLAAREKGNKS